MISNPTLRYIRFIKIPRTEFLTLNHWIMRCIRYSTVRYYYKIPWWISHINSNCHLWHTTSQSSLSLWCTNFHAETILLTLQLLSCESDTQLTHLIMLLCHGVNFMCTRLTVSICGYIGVNWLVLASVCLIRENGSCVLYNLTCSAWKFDYGIPWLHV